jgi:hypothetical protein
MIPITITKDQVFHIGGKIVSPRILVRKNSSNSTVIILFNLELGTKVSSNIEAIKIGSFN